MITTTTLNEIFNHTYDQYKDYMLEELQQYGSVNDSSDLYILRPIWRKYKNYYIRFSCVRAFLDNLLNQLSEVAFDFTIYAKNNIAYYEEQLANNKNPFDKTIVSNINPINEVLNQERDKTKLASGTTGQMISEKTYNGIAWNKMCEDYFTPNRRTTMLKTFNWLFIKMFTRGYDMDFKCKFQEEEGEEE